MKHLFSFYLAGAVVLIACSFSQAAQPTLALEKDDHITLIGNALAEAGVRALLRNHDVDSASILCHQIPTNDAWARDHGPIFITRSVGAAALLPP